MLSSQPALSFISLGWRGKCIEAATVDGISIGQALLRFNVPKSTLGDRISGRVEPGAVSSPPKYLSAGEEEELVQFLLRCSSIGYPRTRKEVLCLVQSIVESRGIAADVTGGWWESFCRRNPTLTLRTPAPLSRARACSPDPDAISRYFELLEQTIIDNDLLEKPCQVFNIDERGLSLDPKSVKCIHKRGMNNPLAPATGDKSQITAVACVSACGSCMPPMIILDRKTLPPYFTVGRNGLRIVSSWLDWSGAVRYFVL